MGGDWADAIPHPAVAQPASRERQARIQSATLTLLLLPQDEEYSDELELDESLEEEEEYTEAAEETAEGEAGHTEATDEGEEEAAASGRQGACPARLG